MFGNMFDFNGDGKVDILDTAIAYADTMGDEGEEEIGLRRRKKDYDDVFDRDDFDCDWDFD